MKRAMFYVMSFTWGLLMNIAGGLLTLCFIFDGYDPKIYRGCVCIEVGERWGGLSLGMFIFCQRGASDRLKDHEFGHAVQNCFYGPIMLLFVICSATRYHYITRREKQGKPVPKYDAWWFEGQATKIGTRYL